MDAVRRAPTRAAEEPSASTVVAFAAVVALGGVNGVAAKELVRELDPFWTGALRFMVAGLLMTSIALITRRPLPRGRSLLGAVAYGALGFAITFGLFFSGLRSAPVSTAAVFLALTPLFTLGLAIAHGQERFRIQSLIGALLALAGCALIFADQLASNVPLVSLLLLTLGAAALAETGVVVKLIPRSDPLTTNAVAMVCAALALLAVSFVAQEAWRLPSRPSAWLSFVYFATLGSVLLFGLFVYVLKRWTASAVSYSDLLIPLVTIAIATVLTGERVSGAFLIGGVVVLAGVYVGAFAALPRRRAAIASLPECLAVERAAGAVKLLSGVQDRT